MIIPREFINRGHKISGVVHIGINDGAEIPTYLEMGIANIVCFEPLPKAAAFFMGQHGADDRVAFAQIAFGDHNGYEYLTVTSGHGQQSTFLPALNKQVAFGEYEPVSRLLVHMSQFDSFCMTAPPEFQDRIRACNCLVVDVQGMEHQVLAGMTESLKRFDCAGIECSGEPIYEGEAPESEVVTLMARAGFKALNSAGQHGDVLFVRKQ